MNANRDANGGDGEEEEEEERGQLSGYPLIDRAIFFVFRNLVTIVKYVLVLLLLLVSSYFSYRWIHKVYFPKYIMYEPVFFDYSNAVPQANISLWAKEKQWQYVNGRSPNTILKDERLTQGAKYMFLLDFRLAYSPRNVEAGHFMTYLGVFDSNNEAMARSARPVVLPYKSFITSTLDTLVYYPLRFIPFRKSSSIDVVDVQVELMNDYVEPSNKKEPYTSLLEVQLSSNLIDIESVQLSVMPEMSWFQWLLFYYPVFSFIIIFTFSFWFQVGSISACTVAYYLYQLISGDGVDENAGIAADDVNNGGNNNGGNNNGGGNNNNGNVAGGSGAVVDNDNDNGPLGGNDRNNINENNRSNMNSSSSERSASSRNLSASGGRGGAESDSDILPNINDDPNMLSLLSGDHSGLINNNISNANRSCNSSSSSAGGELRKRKLPFSSYK